MIILLEGPNGVGKTTYAEHLSMHFDWPVYRAFRRSGKYQMGQVERYSAMGVPINTYVDDLYAADFIRAFNPSLILDRAIPSAIAYDKVFKQGTIKSYGEVLREWCDLLSNATVMYAWLDAPYETAEKRFRGVTPTWTEYNQLRNIFQSLFVKLKFDFKVKVDTGKLDIQTGVGMICQRLKNCDG